MKKKTMALLLAAILGTVSVAGCGSSGSAAGSADSAVPEESAATEAEEAVSEAEEAEEAASEAAPAAEAEDDYTVKICQGPALCSAPVFIAMINGYMEECGVKYDYNNSENQWDAMAGGHNDINYGLLPTFVQRIANGYDMKIVGGAHYGCINAVATDASGIESIADLKGRNVGIPGGMRSDPAILLQRMLTANGIGVTDVNLQVFDNADLATALKEGQIEAFISWDPYASIVAGYEGNHLFFEQAADEATKDEYCCLFGFSNSLVEEHPDVAKRYVQALSMACDFIAENPVEAAKLCYEEGYIADEDYEFNGKLLESYNYEVKFQPAKDSFISVTKDLQNLGIIEISSTPEEMADKCFVNAGEVEV